MLCQVYVTSTSDVTRVMSDTYVVVVGSVLCVTTITCVINATCPTDTTCGTSSSELTLALSGTSGRPLYCPVPCDRPESSNSDAAIH